MDIKTKPLPLLTPRERFQTEPQRITAHRAMVERESFQSALDYAMLEYQRQVQQSADANNQLGALAGYFRILGAQEFAQVMTKLAEPAPAPPAFVPPPRLNHNA